MGCVQAPGADVQTCCIITLPWPFISTMLQMMKAWTLLQEWTRWAELREREGRGMGCGGGRRRGTDGRQHPQSGSTHTRGEASRTHTHIGFTHTHTHTGFTHTHTGFTHTHFSSLALEPSSAKQEEGWQIELTSSRCFLEVISTPVFNLSSFPIVLKFWTEIHIFLLSPSHSDGLSLYERVIELCHDYNEKEEIV